MTTENSDVLSMKNTTDTPLNTTHHSNDQENASKSLAVIFWLSLLVLMMTTCLANGAVMICTRIEKRMRTLTNLYVFSLAVADFAVGVAVYWGILFYSLYGYWPYGDLVCSLWVGFDFTCTAVSMIHLCLIAYDRYVALVRPLNYRNKTEGKTLILIALSWVAGILLWIPAMITIRHSGNYQHTPQTCLFVPHSTYVIIQSCVAYYCPIIVMVYFYAMCLKVLKQRYRRTENSKRNEIAYDRTGARIGQDSDTTNNSIIETDRTTEMFSINKVHSLTVQPQQDSSSGDTRRNIARITIKASIAKGRLELRVIRTFGIVIFVFLFLWLPWCLFWPITAFCETCIPFGWYVYSYWAAYLNSTINPFLYFLFNKDFRHAFKVLLMKVFCKQCKSD